MPGLCFKSAVELAALIRKGEASVREVMTDHLEQIERIKDENSVRRMFVTKLLDGIDKVEDNERRIRELALRRGLESLGTRD